MYQHQHARQYRYYMIHRIDVYEMLVDVMDIVVSIDNHLQLSICI